MIIRSPFFTNIGFSPEGPPPVGKTVSRRATLSLVPTPGCRRSVLLMTQWKYLRDLRHWYVSSCLPNRQDLGAKFGPKIRVAGQAKENIGEGNRDGIVSWQE